MRILRIPAAFLLLTAFVVGPSLSFARPLQESAAETIRHVTVAADSARFKAWPASMGFWSWGAEILVAYRDCELDTTTDGHAAVWPTCGIEQARSTDGGLTWAVEVPRTNDGRKISQQSRPSALDVPMDFTHPDFAWRGSFAGSLNSPSFYYSYDRGRRWFGPYLLPNFDLGVGDLSASDAYVGPEIDYIVNGQRDMMAFFFYGAPPYSSDAADAVLNPARPFLVRTRDGGLMWSLVSATASIVTEPNPPGAYYGEEPSSVRLSPTKLVSLSRWAFTDPEGQKTWWIETWTSDDDGQSWSLTSRFTDGPAMRPNVVLLPDGRLVVTYELRAAPYGIRARISEDQGSRWSDPFILRSDGGSWDIGYTRNVLRADGMMVTVYYFNREAHGARTIEATIWDPYSTFKP